MRNANIQEIINKSIGRVSLVAVPLLFSLSELFHPITRDTILGEMKSARENSVTWLVSHALALLAITFLPFLVQKLLCFIDEKKKLLIFGVVSSYIGIVGVTGLLVYDFILWDAWKVGNDGIVAKFLEMLNNSTFGLIFLVSGPILFLIGFLTLIFLMVLSVKTKKWNSILVLIGLIIYGLAGPLVPISNGHILVSIGAIIMLIGFIGVLIEDIKKTCICN